MTGKVERVSATLLVDDISITFTCDADGWRFEKWGRDSWSTALQPLDIEPAPFDAGRHFTTFEEALAFFRSAYGSTLARC